MISPEVFFLPRISILNRPNFGKYYALYSEIAIARSKYTINNTSYVLSEHVTDPKALEVAIKAVKYDMETSRENDPTEIDT